MHKTLLLFLFLLCFSALAISSILPATQPLALKPPPPPRPSRTIPILSRTDAAAFISGDVARLSVALRSSTPRFSRQSAARARFSARRRPVSRRAHRRRHARAVNRRAIGALIELQAPLSTPRTIFSTPHHGQKFPPKPLHPLLNLAQGAHCSGRSLRQPAHRRRRAAAVCWCRYKHEEYAVRYALLSRYFCNTSCSYGRSALQIAADTGNADIVRLLLQVPSPSFFYSRICL